jgi:hypothetical protein
MVHGPPSIWGKTTLGLSKNLGENHGKKKNNGLSSHVQTVPIKAAA